MAVEFVIPVDVIGAQLQPFAHLHTRGHLHSAAHSHATVLSGDTFNKGKIIGADVLGCTCSESCCATETLLVVIVCRDSDGNTATPSSRLSAKRVA